MRIKEHTLLKKYCWYFQQRNLICVKPYENLIHFLQKTGVRIVKDESAEMKICLMIGEKYVGKFSV